MTHQDKQAPLFYLTSPAPCPYLAAREERKVFTHLYGADAKGLNDLLTQGGFRRSQNIAYRPACEACRACVSVRILVNAFEPSSSFKRTLKRNKDVLATPQPPKASTEQFSLFRRYLDARHPEGGMADMSPLDYVNMVEETHVNTRLVEYRKRFLPGNDVLASTKGQLLGACITDTLSDGLSLVYSFYDPEATKRSLGSYFILDHIERAKALGLPYLYLGYWVQGSKKMDYKTRFQPIEYLGRNGWSLEPPAL